MEKIRKQKMILDRERMQSSSRAVASHGFYREIRQGSKGVKEVWERTQFPSPSYSGPLLESEKRNVWRRLRNTMSSNFHGNLFK